ncbi:MAG: APC family permease [Anaerolineales bacterium]|nr:APC family permease [Anaerolineales bacterium]
MFNTIKDLIIGSPLPTRQLGEKRLNKIRALAAFSPDALSSIAYANQEIFLGLVVAGSAGLALSWPIGLAITGLLLLVALSYFQTVHGYPTGGGSYIVARQNLGTLPGLIAASALTVDYLLNVAVSVTAGVAAIASAFPVLWSYRVALSLGLLFVITIINLRGLRETGSLMAIPVYLFLFTYIPMLAYGVIRAVIDGPGTLVAVAPPHTAPLTLFLLLHTFSTGCTALTGIEAISNGVPAFQPPEAKNAGRTLIVMAVLMGVLFLGSVGLTQYLAVVAGSQETILSALARRLLGSGPAYLLIQSCTMLILVVAANTSFAGFPRLAAILAGDGFLPRQLTSLGDRLVFTNGILILAVAGGALIFAFNGDTHALIPLFAIGAFLAFTLSQAGMVVHWWRERGKGWWLKSIVNGVGALATTITVVVVVVSKFIEGAWITVFIIPIFVAVFLRIRAHYHEVAHQLSMDGLPPSLKPVPILRIVVPISGVHRGIVDAINFARSISDNVTAVYVELEPGAGERVREKLAEWWPDLTLTVVPSPYRSIIGPLLDFLEETDRLHNDGQLAALVLPEFIPAKWWQTLLHNQTAWLIKAALLYRRRYPGFPRVIIDIPYHLRR